MSLANVPSDTFDTAVESGEPPTITALAEAGTKKRDWAPPNGFEEATKLLGTVRRFSEFCDANKPKMIDPGLIDDQAA